VDKKQLTTNFLRKNKIKKYTSINLAKELMLENNELKLKMEGQVSKQANKTKPENQLSAEIGAWFTNLKKDNLFFLEVKRVKENKKWNYYYDKEDFTPIIKEEIIEIKEKTKNNQKEYSLYPILIQYLKSKKIISKRIDERKSKNNRGKNGNKWLHPDVVGLQCLSNNFIDSVKYALKSSSDNILECFSYEVKNNLNITNLRESFFQTVSNSSWANESYLVCESYQENIMEELNMLSQLHGVGLIKLNKENPEKSKIIIQAKKKDQLDWLSINRLAKENEDFNNFVRLMENYYNTGGNINL
jgi:hypothetical protein